MADGPTVYLAFGANLGNRVAALRTGVNYLARRGVEPQAFSSLYQSAPQYMTEQPPFVNCVGRFRTRLEPVALLTLCKEAEAAAGRQPRERYGPRELDVDILLYGTAVVAEEGLQIPHPGIAERLFVLVPLAELDPDLQIPDLGPVSGLLETARQAAPATGRIVSLGAFEPGRGRALDGTPG